MAIISADGKVWPPWSISPRTLHKWRTRDSAEVEKFYDYLPAESDVVHCTPPPMDRSIFQQLVAEFVKHAAELHRKSRYFLLMLDFFSGHVTYTALKSLLKMKVFFIDLPAHPIHRTHFLDHTEFFRFNHYIQNILNARLQATEREQQNEV